jgi:hypothetical protein
MKPRLNKKSRRLIINSFKPYGIKSNDLNKLDDKILLRLLYDTAIVLNSKVKNKLQLK